MPIPPAKITAGELVVVLSHYDLGAIESVRRYRGGSRHSPKVLITSSQGEFLLKRRGAGTDLDTDPATHAGISERVAFSHQVQMHLARNPHPFATFPLPPLKATRDGRTMLDLPSKGVYELFGYLHGNRYSRDVSQARDAGALLATLHALTRDLGPIPETLPPAYHNRSDMPQRLATIRDRFQDPNVPGLTTAMLETYQHAASQGESLGVSLAPAQVVHGDWHPGNMLFRASSLQTPGAPQFSSVLAVVDMDTCRFGHRVLDLANGAMQFAILRSVKPAADGSGGNPDSSWRIVIGPEQLTAFCAGYRSATPSDNSLRPDDWRALPWLMVEALIVEAVLPIAATGRFGNLNPLLFLALVERTAHSLVQENARLVAMVGGT